MLTCPFCGELPNNFVTLKLASYTGLNTYLRYFLECEISCPKQCVKFTNKIELYDLQPKSFNDLQEIFSELEQKWNTRAYV